MPHKNTLLTRLLKTESRKLDGLLLARRDHMENSSCKGILLQLLCADLWCISFQGNCSLLSLSRAGNFAYLSLLM